MRLSPQERADRRNAFIKMNMIEKLDYIWSYYKFPVIMAIILIYIMIYAGYRHFSRKETALYIACVNISTSENTESALFDGFLDFAGIDRKKNKIYIYQALYLSDNPTLANHEYAYASRLKLLAAANAGQLDVFLMNREAYNILSESGYLLELPPILEQENPKFLEQLRPFLIENNIILTDNAIERDLNETDEYYAVTKREINAAEISDFPVLREIDFTDEIFLGIAPNSPRLANAMEYINYLLSDPGLSL